MGARNTAITIGLACLFLTGCVRGSMRRAFAVEHPPRPEDAPVAVTFDAGVDEALVPRMGGTETAPPPTAARIGWAGASGPGPESTLEALKGQVRLLGGDAVHVHHAREYGGWIVEGWVYRGPPLPYAPPRLPRAP